MNSRRFIGLVLEADTNLLITANSDRSCPFWVISCHGAVKVARPLYPRKLPRKSPTGVSALGHKRTHAPQQKSFDQLVGAVDERERDAQAERFRSL
jgi:hypothetical protein